MFITVKILFIILHFILWIGIFIFISNNKQENFWPVYRKVITRSNDTPYLIRYSLAPIRFLLGEDNWFSSRFAIKVHNILLSDHACQHDHPWAFLSIILKGGYYEWRPVIYKGQMLMTRFIAPDSVTANGTKNWRWNEAGFWEYAKYKRVGSILFRKPKAFHRLELLPKHQGWTLVFTFKKIRKWGFQTRNGWVFWRSYNNKENC